MLQVAPGVLSDVLLCLTSLQHLPSPGFVRQLLDRALGVRRRLLSQTLSTAAEGAAAAGPDGTAASNSFPRPYTGVRAAVGLPAPPSSAQAPYTDVRDMLSPGERWHCKEE
jgi:hypothetical protein